MSKQNEIQKNGERIIEAVSKSLTEKESHELSPEEIGKKAAEATLREMKKILSEKKK